MAIEHSTITSANCHEPKYISSSTTADAGKVITPSSVTGGTSELRKVKVSELDPAGQTSWGGWGKWVDTVYTSSSTLAINPVARTQITNNGAGSQTNLTYLPSGGADYWDTVNNKFVIDNEGDSYLYRINFKGSTNTANSYFVVELDIGGSIGTVLQDTKTFPKGVSTTHNFVFTWPVFGVNTFATNGGTLYITPSSVDQSFWDFEIQVNKLYSGA